MGGLIIAAGFRPRFQEIVRDHNGNVEAYISLAKACTQTNELPIAFAAAKKAQRLAPERCA